MADTNPSSPPKKSLLEWIREKIGIRAWVRGNVLFKCIFNLSFAASAIWFLYNSTPATFAIKSRGILWCNATCWQDPSESPQLLEYTCPAANSEVVQNADPHSNLIQAIYFGGCSIVMFLSVIVHDFHVIDGGTPPTSSLTDANKAAYFLVMCYRKQTEHIPKCLLWLWYPLGLVVFLINLMLIWTLLLPVSTIVLLLALLEGPKYEKCKASARALCYYSSLSMAFCAGSFLIRIAYDVLKNGAFYYVDITNYDYSSSLEIECNCFCQYKMDGISYGLSFMVVVTALVQCCQLVRHMSKAGSRCLISLQYSIPYQLSINLNKKDPTDIKKGLNKLTDQMEPERIHQVDIEVS